jgi:hypothetical protein
MRESRQSKRFKPNAIMDKLVPVVLILLALALLAVIVIVALSLAGIIPAA